MVRIKRNQRHSLAPKMLRVENSLLGYGAACRTTSEEASVNTAAMFLDSSAKFWWQTKRRKERGAWSAIRSILRTSFRQKGRKRSPFSDVSEQVMVEVLLSSVQPGSKSCHRSLEFSSSVNERGRALQGGARQAGIDWLINEMGFPPSSDRR